MLCASAGRASSSRPTRGRSPLAVRHLQATAQCSHQTQRSSAMGKERTWSGEDIVEERINVRGSHCCNELKQMVLSLRMRFVAPFRKSPPFTPPRVSLQCARPLFIAVHFERTHCASLSVSFLSLSFFISVSFMSLSLFCLCLFSVSVSSFASFSFRSLSPYVLCVPSHSHPASVSLHLTAIDLLELLPLHPSHAPGARRA